MKMSERDARSEVKRIHGIHAEIRKVKHRCMVGRKGSDGKFHCEGAGQNWYEAMANFFSFHIEMEAQTELQL